MKFLIYIIILFNFFWLNAQDSIRTQAKINRFGISLYDISPLNGNLSKLDKTSSNFSMSFGSFVELGISKKVLFRIGLDFISYRNSGVGGFCIGILNDDTLRYCPECAEIQNNYISIPLNFKINISKAKKTLFYISYGISANLFERSSISRIKPTPQEWQTGVPKLNQWSKWSLADKSLFVNLNPGIEFGFRKSLSLQIESVMRYDILNLLSSYHNQFALGLKLGFLYDF